MNIGDIATYTVTAEQVRIVETNGDYFKVETLDEYTTTYVAHRGELATYAIRLVVHTDEVVVVTDEQGRPWVFTFNSDPGLDVAIAPSGQQFHTYTHDGSTPKGVPETLWVTMRGLIDPDFDLYG